MTHAQIAQELNVSRQAVSRALNKHGTTRWDGGKSGSLYKDLSPQQLQLMERFNLKKRWHSKKTYLNRRNQVFHITLAQWVEIYQEQIALYRNLGLSDDQVNQALQHIHILAKDTLKPMSISNYRLHDIKKKNE